MCFVICHLLHKAPCRANLCNFHIFVSNLHKKICIDAYVILIFVFLVGSKMCKKHHVASTSQQKSQQQQAAMAPLFCHFSNAFAKTTVLPAPAILPAKQQAVATLQSANWWMLSSPLAILHKQLLLLLLLQPSFQSPPVHINPCAATVLVTAYKQA